MRQKTLYLLICIITGLCCFSCTIYAQAGGNNTWEFLNLTNSARIASLGGRNISLRDGDLNLVFNNPALLDSTMNNHLVVNYVNYFTDINIGYVSWAHHHDKFGNFAAGIHYINYGKFTGADPNGIITGEFTASENSLNLSWAMPLDSMFSAGVTLKGIYSSFEKYSSSGVALDAGINYYNPGKLLSASIVMKNLGTQITTFYRGGEREPLPFELQLGMTKQLAHAPFRISMVYQYLQDFNLNVNKKSDSSAGNTSTPGKIEQIGAELFRHLIVGVEFIPLKTFSLQTGFNSLRRHELKIDERVSTVGFPGASACRSNDSGLVSDRHGIISPAHPTISQSAPICLPSTEINSFIMIG
jgi:hypothetical protein